MARQEEPHLVYDNWGGLATVVLGLLEAACPRVVAAPKALHEQGGGFAALVADAAAGAGGLPRLAVNSNFANTYTEQQHLYFLKPIGEDFPLEDDSYNCMCARTNDPADKKTPAAQMASVSGVHWGPTRGELNIYPYFALGQFPVTCEGCEEMAVFRAALPAKLVSRTPWSALLRGWRRQGELLAVATVLGACAEDHNREALVTSAVAFGIRLMILHDQPGCSWLEGHASPLVGVLPVDGTAFAHLPKGERGLLYIMELLDYLRTAQSLPGYVLFVDSETIFTGNPVPYMRNYSNDYAAIFVQQEWQTVKQAHDTEELVRKWKGEFNAVVDKHWLNFDVWGASAAHALRVLDMLKARLDRSYNWMRRPEGGASASYLNEIMRLPWLHFKVITDFVNIYTRRHHEVLLEEGTGGCACARASSREADLQQAKLLPFQELCWSKEVNPGQVRDNAVTGALPVRCRGCGQMTVFHGASPKRSPR